MALNTVQYNSSQQVSRKGDNPSSATVLASMAVLVADGAAPTQAHVTTCNGDLNTFLAALGVIQTGQVIIQYDTTLTKNQIRTALQALLFQIEGTS